MTMELMCQMLALTWLITPSDGALQCFNFDDCRGMQSINQKVECEGELSCANTISWWDEQSCNGDHSCSNSILYNPKSFEAQSALSLYNTTIYISNNKTVENYIRGYYAMFNSSIYCNNNSTCLIDCMGNSCVNLNLFCDDTSNCTLDGTMTYETDIKNAPMYYRGNLPMMPSISESSIVTDAYNGGIYCENEGYCRKTIITIDESYYNIYCRGKFSCQYSRINVNDNIDNNGIYCSGSYSCVNTSMSVYNNNNNNNNENNNNMTVYCGSHRSCRRATIIGFNKIYAMGLESLLYSTIISNGNNNEMNVYFASYGASGENTNANSTIYCNFTDTCNIYCDARKSCAYAIAHCYGTCNIFCDTLINQQCLTVYDYSQSPTSLPTETTTAAVVSSEQEKQQQQQHSSYVNYKSWQIGGYVCLTFSLTAPIIIGTMAYYYHKQAQYKYIDQPNYFAIFACYWNFGDFYSDLIFTVVLIQAEKMLGYISLIFLLTPYFISNFLSLYNIKKWHTYNIYLSKYIGKYDWLVICVSVVAGFYTSIELARSKLFYLEMFTMQLKTVDYHQIQNLRFFNTVLLENIPQFIIQILYTIDTGSFDIFVLSAMIFSVLSTMISISQRLKSSNAAYDTKIAPAASKLVFKTKKQFKMKIECNYFRNHHKYCHNVLTNILNSILQTDATSDIEVFYTISIKNGIIAYIDVCDMNGNDSYNEMNHKNSNNDNIGEGTFTKSTLFNKLLEMDDNCLASRIDIGYAIDHDNDNSNNNNNNNNMNENDKNEQNNINKLFKMEICEKFGFIYDNETNMRIAIEEDTQGLSVRTHLPKIDQSHLPKIHKSVLKSASQSRDTHD